MIAPILKMDRMIIVIVLITLNLGREETLRFFLLNFVVKIGVCKRNETGVPV
jgi:hypothetical protein